MNDQHKLQSRAQTDVPVVNHDLGLNKRLPRKGHVGTVIGGKVTAGNVCQLCALLGPVSVMQWSPVDHSRAVVVQ